MRRFTKLLFVFEKDTVAARASLRLALDIARQNEGAVDIISVVQVPASMLVSNTGILLQDRLLKTAAKELSDFRKSAAKGTKLQTKLLEGRPHIQIVREVLRGNYDLVVKPVGASGLVDRLLGNLDMRLLRHCPCPVWLSKGETYNALQNVLAAVDMGEPENEPGEEALNRQIMELAFSLCAAASAQLHVGHAWFPKYMVSYNRARRRISKKVLDEFLADERKSRRALLDKLMRKVAKWVGEDMFAAVRRRTHLRRGVAEEEIPKLIKRLGVDLVIMGTVARTGIPGLLMGNTAEEILDRVTCSVLAVKPPGFVSQIELDD